MSMPDMDNEIPPSSRHCCSVCFSTRPGACEVVHPCTAASSDDLLFL